jgi:hypothetical protein
MFPNQIQRDSGFLLKSQGAKKDRGEVAGAQHFGLDALGYPSPGSTSAQPLAAKETTGSNPGGGFLRACISSTASMLEWLKEACRLSNQCVACFCGKVIP